jgi:membrane protein implicated in regulation of membrane protease activity
MTRDLRGYARQTNIRLIGGALLLLFIVGDGLIYLIYGKSAALMGLLCLLAGLTPVALTLFALSLLAWVTKKVMRE